MDPADWPRARPRGDSRNPAARIRDISEVVGLRERAVQAIMADLEAPGYLTRDRAGHRNVYTVNPDMLFRHPAQEGHWVGPFLDLLAASGDDLEDKLARLIRSRVTNTLPHSGHTGLPS